MDLLNQIREHLPQLTPGERRAAEYILEYPFDAVRFPSSTIAGSAGTSRSNVVRFCQKLGFSGYAEFTYALGRILKDRKHLSPTQKQPSSAETVLQKYLNEFAKLETLYHSTQLREIAKIITSARRVLILGRDHSFFSAQQLSFQLNRAGIGSMATQMDTVMGSYGDILDHQDAVIVFSVQALKQSYEHILKSFREKNVRIVLITTAQKPPVASYADQVVLLPSAARSYSRDMLDEAPTFYLFIELLMEAIHALPALPSVPSEVQEK